MKKRIFTLFYILGVITFQLLDLMAFDVFALDVDAISCGETDIEDAVEKVEAAGGGSVLIPEGDCTWEGPVYINGTVNMIGSGYDKTIIRKASGAMIQHRKAGNSRYTGLGFYGGDASASRTTSAIYLAGGVDFQIYDNKFYQSKWHGVITLKSCSRGLIYNNVFERVPEGTSNYGIQMGSNYVEKPKICDFDDPACIATWDQWWDDETTNSGVGFPENFNAGSDLAVFIEDNVFTWAGPALEGNWGSKQSVVFRYNKVYGQTGSSYASVKPGAIWAEIYNNLFECAASSVNTNCHENPNGKASYFRSSGLFYNNTLVNLKYGGNFAAYYCGFGYCYTEQVLQDEAYIFDNTYENVLCAEDSARCWTEWNEGAPERIAEGENYFFRSPQSGDRIYPYTPYRYPHPDRIDVPLPIRPSAPAGLRIEG